MGWEGRTLAGTGRTEAAAEEGGCSELGRIRHLEDSQQSLKVGHEPQRDAGADGDPEHREPLSQSQRQYWTVVVVMQTDSESVCVCDSENEQ